VIDTATLLDRLTADSGRAALFLDFDGTLAPIVDDPAASRMPDEVGATVAALAERLGVVALVSGRPAAFLAERADIAGPRRLGLYGLEEWRDGRAVARPEAARWQDQVDEAKAQLRRVLADVEGVTIEDKGLSVAVHWRNAPDRDAAGQAVAAAMRRTAEVTGLGREPGKLVDELRPPVAWDKGSAVRAVVDEVDATAVAYVGDDLGDLAAFRVAKELGGWGVAVEHGEETPDELVRAADLVVAGTAGVAELLAGLRERLESR
jgi:trehalose 6-phosphate phosphatase